MCGNRVEELEARVKELEASIEGLTDELVECKVRLREMEDAVDDDLGFESGAGDTDEDTGSDIVEPSPSEAEGSKPAGTQKGDDTEESDADDDIIVA
ncbi:DUF7518 family protein [Halomicrobium urmianum]|uniref:DUF7518 family protein n=1 Tax=Halomicrobium urmianum TaxID=1586233 RepID=UPI001CD9B92E|nr:bZIP transcription factor [Halomicrobium urmianum]